MENPEQDLLYIKKEFFDTLTQEQFQAFMQTLRVINSIRLSMKSILVASKSASFLNGESLELYFNLFSTYNEGLKAFSQNLYKDFSSINGYVNNKKLDDIIKIYIDTKNEYQTNQKIFRYIRDNASFHFRKDYLKKYANLKNTKSDVLFGIKSNDDILLTYFINTVMLHINEISTITDIELDEVKSLKYFNAIVQNEIHPIILCIEQIVNGIIKNYMYLSNVKNV